MKNSKLLVCSFWFLIFGITQISAQQSNTSLDKSNDKVQRHTIMEQFAPDLVVPLNERLAMKELRENEIKRKIAILDTLNISSRKRKKLLRDVKFSPFSDRVEKAIIANSTFEDDVDQ